MSYVLNWVIPDELLGETLYFIATARQARLGQDAVQSAEISSEMVLDDPTNTDPESGNRVYQGGLDSARAWSATAGTLEWDQASPYSIEADATVPGGDWTNPDNAHDGDDLTYGELTVDSGNTGLVAFTFAAGTLSGQPFARVRTTKNNAAMVVQYSTDGGGSWSDVAQVSVRQGLVDVYGPLLVSQNMANFQMRVGGGSGRGIGAPYAEGHHRAYTVGFVDIAGATPPYVILANGLATFVSDGITAAELKRPFPGKIPDPTVLAYNAQSTATVGLDLRRTPGETSALDANMTVYIKEKLTGTEYLAADFDKDDIPTDGVFDALVQRFTPGAAIPGDCEIIIRYLGTVALDLDNIEETLGEGVPRQFQASTVDQEEGNYGDAASGKRVGFTRGLWPTVVTRISQITGGTK
ncbi:MAG: hypothetical protein GY716_21460 [bacterium]|nr:hypothetical protein [bacterium]